MYSEEYNEEETRTDENFFVSFYRNNKILVWILIGVLAFLLIMSLLTKGGSNSVKKNYNVEILYPEEKSVIVARGNTYTMIAKVTDDPNAAIVWSVDNEKIAKVDNGTVKAIDYGKVIVTATYTDGNNEKHTDTREIVVADGDPNIKLIDVSFESGELFMMPNDTFEILLSPNPPNSYIEDKSFTSDDERIVTVDDDGIVKAVGEGDTAINLNVNDGTYRKKLNVHVKRDYGVTKMIIVPEKITFDKELYKIKVGAKDKLIYTSLPTNIDTTKLVWKSDDENVATVDENGYVKGISVGKTKVTLSSINGISDQIDIEVETDIVDVSDISVSLSSVNMNVGQTQEITPVVIPDNASNKALSFTSSDPSIAGVVTNETGTSATITAFSQGTASIIIRSNNGVEKSLVIYVTGGSNPQPTQSNNGGSSDNGTIKVRSNHDNLAKKYEEVVNIPVDEKSTVTVEIHSGVSYVMYGMAVYGSTCNPSIKKINNFTIEVPRGNIFEICITKHRADGSEIPATSSGNYQNGALRYYVNTGTGGNSTSSTATCSTCVNICLANGGSSEAACKASAACKSVCSSSSTTSPTSTCDTCVNTCLANGGGSALACKASAACKSVCYGSATPTQTIDGGKSCEIVISSNSSSNGFNIKYTNCTDKKYGFIKDGICNLIFITTSDVSRNFSSNGNWKVCASGKSSDGTYVTQDKTFTYTKTANAVCPTLVNYTGYYDGVMHYITVTGGSGGTIQYSTNGTTWSDTKIGRKESGITTVYVRVNGDSTHNTVECGSATITLDFKPGVSAKKCDPGYYLSSDGVNCIACGPGSYCSDNKKYSCPSGYNYTMPDSNGSILFENNDGRKYANALSFSLGKTKSQCAIEVPKGKYLQSTGLTYVMEYCNIGYYSDSNRLVTIGTTSSCQKCPTGYSTKYVGSTSSGSCTECEKGYHKDSSSRCVKEQNFK